MPREIWLEAKSQNRGLAEPRLCPELSCLLEHWSAVKCSPGSSWTMTEGHTRRDTPHVKPFHSPTRGNIEEFLSFFSRIFAKMPDTLNVSHFIQKYCRVFYTQLRWSLLDSCSNPLLPSAWTVLIPSVFLCASLLFPCLEHSHGHRSPPPA